MSAQTSDQPNNDMLYEVADNIATITFNRPEQKNTISRDMLASFTELLIKADADEEVRAIVITGTGKFFCAGLDLRGSDISEGLSDRTRRVSPTLDLRNTPPTVLHNIDTPTIAALNGSAAGYGMDMTLLCDIRIMSENAKLAAVTAKRNVVPESGGTWLLPRLVGWAKAAELYYRARTVDAAESLSLGVVNEVVAAEALLPTAMSWAHEIADNAPMAVQTTKRMMRMGLEESYDTAVDHLMVHLNGLFQSEDFAEGLSAFLEKRKPNFTGR